MYMYIYTYVCIKHVVEYTICVMWFPTSENSMIFYVWVSLLLAIFTLTHYSTNLWSESKAAATLLFKSLTELSNALGQYDCPFAQNLQNFQSSLQLFIVTGGR